MCCGWKSKRRFVSSLPLYMQVSLRALDFKTYLVFVGSVGYPYSGDEFVRTSDVAGSKGWREGIWDPQTLPETVVEDRFVASFGEGDGYV